MLFGPLFPDLDSELCNGTWTREQLIEMNDRFVAAVSNAIRSGRESAAAVSATVRINSSLNGSRRRTKEAAVIEAIEVGWTELCRRKGDMAFLEVAQVVREQCLVDLEVIRRGLAHRLRERREELWADNVKGEKPRNQSDRARGGPVITVVSRFVKLELLRTNMERSEYGPKQIAGGELTKERSSRPVMKVAQEA